MGVEVPEHLSVVEHFDEDHWGMFWRSRCLSCPWASSAPSEAGAYGLAEAHFDVEDARTKLGQLERQMIGVSA